METVQIVLVGSVGLLTVVLALAGVQIIRILGEIKKTVEKINKILDDMGRVTGQVAQPESTFSGIFFGLKTGAKILRVLLARHKKRKENE